MGPVTGAAPSEPHPAASGLGRCPLDRHERSSRGVRGLATEPVQPAVSAPSLPVAPRYRNAGCLAEASMAGRAPPPGLATSVAPPAAAPIPALAEAERAVAPPGARAVGAITLGPPCPSQDETKGQ